MNKETIKLIELSAKETAFQDVCEILEIDEDNARALMKGWEAGQPEIDELIDVLKEAISFIKEEGYEYTGFREILERYNRTSLNRLPKRLESVAAMLIGVGFFYSIFFLKHLGQNIYK